MLLILQQFNILYAWQFFSNPDIEQYSHIKVAFGDVYLNFLYVYLKTNQVLVPNLLYEDFTEVSSLCMIIMHTQISQKTEEKKETNIPKVP